MFTKRDKGFTLTEKLSIALLFFAGCLILLMRFENGISGNDFWWHIKVGEYIKENLTIPQNDIFSWIGVEKNISWSAHEWLADLVFFCIFDIFGEYGILFLSILISFALFILLFKSSINYGYNIVKK